MLVGLSIAVVVDPVAVVVHALGTGHAAVDGVAGLACGRSGRGAASDAAGRGGCNVVLIRQAVAVVVAAVAVVVDTFGARHAVVEHNAVFAHRGAGGGAVS